MKRRTLACFLFVFFVYAGSLLVLPSPFSSEERTYIYRSRVTYINRGANSQSLEPDLNTFNIFMNTSWQTAYLDKASDVYTLAKDVDGNSIIVFDLPSLPSGGNVTVAYSVRLEMRKRSPPNISFAAAGNLSDIPENIRQMYCEPEGSWRVDEELRSLAKAIWASQEMTVNVLKIVTSLVDWIGNNVKSVSHDFPYYPSETYSSLEGDCDDQANLLIALCRYMGIPAYLQVGSLRWSSKTETFWNDHVTSILIGVSYHAWAVVYVPPWGWLPFDITLGWNPDDSLSVVKSAVVWSLDAIPLLNVMKSDWAGEGRAQKAKIMAGSIYVYYEDTLANISQEGLLPVLVDWRLWSAAIVILLASITAAAIYLRRLKSV